MRKVSMFVAAIAAFGLAAGACGGGKKGDTTTAKADAKLFDRLGGQPAIEKVVGDFITIVVADERINARFQNADAANLKAKLVEQICEATGGPCKYTGKDMVTAHTGMNLTKADFDALVEDLGKALKQNNVGQKEIDELVGALAPMESQIVGK